MRGAGGLRGRVHFQRRGAVDDGMGNVVSGDWKTQFAVRARFAPAPGREQVLAARLEGGQPYILWVRQSSQTRRITPAWRAVDARDPARIDAITAPAMDPDQTRHWLVIPVTEGVAA